jgi:hypothetical protein
VPTTDPSRPVKIVSALAVSLVIGWGRLADVARLRAAPDVFGLLAWGATVS